MPPAGRVGLAHERQERIALPLVVDAVHGEEVDDIAFLETDPPEFHPADLRFRGADAVAGFLPGNSLGLAQPAQLGSEQDTPDSGPAARLDRDHVGPPRHRDLADNPPTRMSRSARPARPTPRSTATPFS